MLSLQQASWHAPWSRGSTPRVPAKEHFLCGTSTENNGLQQDASPGSAMALSHNCHGGPRPAHELHPLQRGNRYMSRRYSNARAVSLADYGFALIPARNKCAAPPTEMNFHLLTSVRTALLHSAASLTCHHGINPSPNTLPLNSTSGLRVRRRLAAE